MRDSIKQLFDNLNGLGELFSQFSKTEMKLGPVQHIIDIAPPFPLFVMANGLKEIAPKWRETGLGLGQMKDVLVPILDDAPIDLFFEASQDKVRMKAGQPPTRACTNIYFTGSYGQVQAYFAGGRHSYSESLCPRVQSAQCVGLCKGPSR